MTLAGYQDEYVEICAVVDRFARDHAVLEEARDLAGTGWYGDRWTGLTGRTGLPGLFVAEDLGGVGLGEETAVAVAEVLGRHLFSGPFLSSTVIATRLLHAHARGGTADPHLVSLASGASTATAAWAESPASWAVPEQPGTTAEEQSDGTFLLSGDKPLVLDGATADTLVVWAAGPGGTPALYLCPADGPGVQAVELPSVDLVTRIASVSFDRAPARPLPTPGGAREALDNAVDLGRLALAAAQTGAARRALEGALAYVMDRRQFDRAIGSFQAVKHLCADMSVAVESSWALVANATRLAATVPGQLAVFAPLVSAHVAEKYTEVAENALHLHGGIGFTWEADAHLHLKNAIATASLLGTPDEDRELVAVRTGLGTDFVPLAFSDR